MNEFYVEQLIKPKSTSGDKVAAVGPLIMGGLLLVKYTMFDTQITNISLVMIVVCLLIVILSVINTANLDKEYEYICTSGDFDFDKIIRKSKRKNLFSFTADDIVNLAPLEIDGHDQYRGVKEYDFSSKKAGIKLYKLVAKQGEDLVAIIFEPSPEMIEKVWTSFPRKVVK